LHIPTSGSLCLNTPSVFCASVNRAVVVDRKTIGPFDSGRFPPEVFEGKEYDMDCTIGRVSSELKPRSMRTIISENYTEAKKGERIMIISEH
jgi:hypothetical protein